MTSKDLREGRLRAAMRQVDAAQQLGLSQAYLSQLENGKRDITNELAQKASELYGLPPTVLPLKDVATTEDVTVKELQEELAAVGYPGFGYVRTTVKANPAKVVYDTVTKKDLDSRFVEALPWVLETYPDLNWEWLRDHVKLRNAQNRLGYVVYLAKQLASSDPKRRALTKTLSDWELELEDARLAKEDTLCRDSMPRPEREWLRAHRPDAAAHWSLLTSLTTEQLSYNKQR
jgi:transcriptional regulator with XRE-family HTH domain